ncbi:phage holin family protein [Bacillus smithii]|uniref:phage holin family protein n=1 Tax=Bacillus smithii TaxID=1479 RepID=UPI002E1FB389|nr:phage holin family protein [Bacillus smithii]MED1456667.1 phage holin family protein [Bacillus smithii]
MKHNTDTLWTTFTGGSASAIAYLIGGIDHLSIALGTMMAADYVSGLMVAIEGKAVSSKSAFKGLMKKAAMLLAVVVANQLDTVTGSGDFMRNAMIMFLIGSEGISFVENLGRLGVSIPVQISKVFAQLKDEPSKDEGRK